MKNIKASTIYHRLGMESNTFHNRLARDTMASNNLAQMLRAMDYKLVAIPSDAKMPTGSIEVE